MNTAAYPITKRDLLNYRRKLRRQQELRRRVVLSVLALFMAFVFALSYNTIISQATEETSDVTYKYFTNYEVSKGDTLWSIAQENIDYEFYDNISDYVAEVAAINRLQDDTIKVGQNLIVPYFSDMYY